MATKKATYDVILVAHGDKKINVIKEVRALTALGLHEAKNLVEDAPVVIRSGLSEKEATMFESALSGTGATIELHPVGLHEVRERQSTTGADARSGALKALHRGDRQAKKAVAKAAPAPEAAPATEPTPQAQSTVDALELVFEKLAIIENQVAGLRIRFDRFLERDWPAAAAAADAAAPAPQAASIAALLREYLITDVQATDEDGGGATDRHYELWKMLEEAEPTTPQDCADLIHFTRHVIVRMEGDIAGMIDEPWAKGLHELLGRLQVRVGRLRERAELEPGA